MKWRSLQEAEPATETRPLREILAERKENFQRYVPAETQAIHARVIRELQENRAADEALPVGVKAPDFNLPDQNGKVISAAEFVGKGRVVLSFIRGRWCPFCVAQLEAMNRILPQIREGDASFLAISPQTVQQSFFMADQHKLQFPLLSDSGNQVARQFGIVYPIPNDQKSIYQRSFTNLSSINGDSSWGLPLPSTFIVDRDGTILFSSVNPDYTERPEPEDILSHLRV